MATPNRPCPRRAFGELDPNTTGLHLIAEYGNKSSSASCTLSSQLAASCKIESCEDNQNQACSTASVLLRPHKSCGTSGESELMNEDTEHETCSSRTSGSGSARRKLVFQPDTSDTAESKPEPAIQSGGPSDTLQPLGSETSTPLLFVNGLVSCHAESTPVTSRSYVPPAPSWPTGMQTAVPIQHLLYPTAHSNQLIPIGLELQPAVAARNPHVGQTSTMQADPVLQRTLQPRIEHEPVMGIKQTCAEDSVFNTGWSYTGFIGEALDTIFQCRQTSVYNTIKYRLAKAILEEWLCPCYLMESSKLRPLQLATGQAGQVVHNTWLELSNGVVPQPKFKDILTNERLFRLETTDGMPNVITLNLNWLLSKVLQINGPQFAQPLLNMVRSSFTDCDEDRSSCKRQLAGYIVSMQCSAGASLERPFAVRCTTAGAVLKHTVGRMGKRGAKFSPSVSQLAADDSRFCVMSSYHHQSEKIIQLDWTAVIFGDVEPSSTADEHEGSTAILASSLCCNGPEQQNGLKQNVVFGVEQVQQGCDGQTTEPLPYKQALVTGGGQYEKVVQEPPLPSPLHRSTGAAPEQPWGSKAAQGPSQQVCQNSLSSGCPKIHLINSRSQFGLVTSLLEGRPKLSLSCQHPREADPAEFATITLYAPPSKAMGQGSGALLIDWQTLSNEDRQGIAAILRPILESEDTQKVVHNASYLGPWLRSANINILSVWDTQVAFALIRVIEGTQPEAMSEMLSLKVDLPTLLEQIGRPTVSLPSASQAQSRVIGGAGYTNWLTIAMEIRQTSGHEAWRQRPLHSELQKIAALQAEPLVLLAEILERRLRRQATSLVSTMSCMHVLNSQDLSAEAASAVVAGGSHYTDTTTEASSLAIQEDVDLELRIQNKRAFYRVLGTGTTIASDPPWQDTPSVDQLVCQQPTCGTATTAATTSLCMENSEATPSTMCASTLSASSPQQVSANDASGLTPWSCSDSDSVAPGHQNSATTGTPPSGAIIGGNPGRTWTPAVSMLDLSRSAIVSDDCSKATDLTPMRPANAGAFGSVSSITSELFSDEEADVENNCCSLRDEIAPGEWFDNILTSVDAPLDQLDRSLVSTSAEDTGEVSRLPLSDTSAIDNRPVVHLAGNPTDMSRFLDILPEPLVSWLKREKRMRTLAGVDLGHAAACQILDSIDCDEEQRMVLRFADGSQEEVPVISDISEALAKIDAALTSKCLHSPVSPQNQGMGTAPTSQWHAWGAPICRGILTAVLPTGSEGMNKQGGRHQPPDTQSAKPQTPPRGLEQALQIQNLLTEPHSLHVPGTLHQIVARISESFQSQYALGPGKPKCTGLTFRFGSYLPGVSLLAEDKLWEIASAMPGASSEHCASLLVIGKPGTGKTLFLRDAAAQLSMQMRQKVLIVDTYNDLSGSDVQSHPSVGSVKRCWVRDIRNQATQMIQAARLFRPDVVVVDNLISSQDVKAVATLISHGVKVLAGIKSSDLQALAGNPNLCSALGLSKPHGARQSLPVFDVMIQMSSVNRWDLYQPLSIAVHQLLQCRHMLAEQRRWRGGVRVSRFPKGMSLQSTASAESTANCTSTGWLTRIFHDSISGLGN